MEQTATQTKSMMGRVVSDGMIKTVSVEVTTFKVHPLYHKRYRWTKKYLSDTGELEPKVGDTVRIESHRPISSRKRWVVVEVINEASQAQQVAIIRAAKAKAVVASKTKKVKAKKA